MSKLKLCLTILAAVLVVSTILGCSAQQAVPTSAPSAPTTAPTAPAAQTPTTSVALILPGSVNDGGWNTLGYQGLKKLEEEGYKVAFTENVDPANAAAVTRGYADEGYDLIIGHGWVYVSDFTTIAPEYPDIDFFMTTPGPDDLSTVPANLQYFDPNFQNAGYMAGALAALSSKTHKVGFVGGGDNPVQRMIGNAFTQAAQDTVPGTEAFIVITGDYNDAARGREAALTMAGNGADVIYHAADITGLGVVSGAVEAGAKAIGMYGDQTSMAYFSFLSSIFQDLGYVVENRGHATRDGTFRNDGAEWMPPLKEIFYFVAGSKDTPFVAANVPADVQAKVLAIYEDMAAGKIQVTSSSE